MNYAEAVTVANQKADLVVVINHKRQSHIAGKVVKVQSAERLVIHDYISDLPCCVPLWVIENWYYLK